MGFDVPDGLPFVDVDATETHTALTRHLSSELSGLGYAHLDVSLVRSERRLVTRLIAMWAYLEALPDGTPRYSGLRFVSKLGNHECWALFEGVPIANVDLRLIPLDELQLACDALGIWAH